MPKLSNSNHEQFCKEYAKTGKMKESYKKAYPKVKDISAQIGANRLIKNEDVQGRLAEILEAKGLGVENLARKHKNLINAKKVMVVKGEMVKVPDNNVQIDALKVGYKLHGVLDRHETNVDQRSVTINFTNESSVELSKIVDKLEVMNRNLGLDDGSQTGEVIDI